MKPERYWRDAREKVTREGVCRNCKSGYCLQFAHVIGRENDERLELEDGTVVTYVDPVDGIPLCIDCHSAYDARRLSILGLLTYEEQAAAVALVGIVRATHRLTGDREYIPVPMPVA